MKKKPSPAPQRSHIWKKIKKLDVWIFLVVIVALAIWVTHGITALRHGRKLIEQDPVRTEARIIEIGKA
ncbi:MAG: hypothetical protein K6A94_07850, partial [Bacteroidales bacterium]|nr:hypothetical protein [Bacteroidales bacterium]